MRPQRVPLLASLVVLLAAACATAHGGAPPPPPTAPPPGASSAVTAPATPPPSTDVASSQTIGDWRVPYGWAVPAAPAQVTPDVRVPVTPAPGEPLPVLVGIQVGDH